MRICRFYFWIISVLLLTSGCAKRSQFVIEGKITHSEEETIYLEELLVSNTKPVDSVKINKNGEFKFTGEVSIPTYYLLKLSDSKFITLLVDSTDNIHVEADKVNFSTDYSVEGSLGSIQVKELTLQLNRTRHKLDSLRNLSSIYRGNPDYEMLKVKWDEESGKIIKDQVDFSTGFVMSNPFSMASILALYQKLDNQQYVINDLQTMRVAASALNSIYPQSEHVKALYNNTLQWLREEQNAQMKKFIDEHGTNSPDVLLPDVNGKEVALSSLRGKIVLLQFWSAVDRGSRIFNPVLVEAYRKYKNKGFEIYQVSVDKNRIEWVDAIDKDQLIWINVGDMEGSNAAVQSFNIKTLPYNYLLDRDGVVMAQNLKGPDLNRVLAEVFK